MAARKNNGVMELWIGFSVIAGILLVAGMIFAWDSRGGAFEKTYPVLVSMPHVGALRSGAPIQLAGIKIGKVGDIRLNADATAVDITCLIDYAIRLPVDSTAHVATMGIVGDSFLEISRGQSHDLIDQDVPSGGEPARLKGASAGDLAEVMKTVTQVGEDVSALISNMNDILGDEEVRKSLKASIININEITVNANKLLTDVQRVVAHVDTSVVHINKATTAFEETAANVKAVGERVRATADAVLSDENVATINASIAGLRRTVDGVERGVERIDGIVAAIAPEKIERLVARLDDAVGKAGDLADKGGRLLESVDVDAVNRGIADAGTALSRLNIVMSKVNPEDVGAAVRNLKDSLGGIQDFIAGVKGDIVFALAANQAATRITDKKFDELKREGLRTADEQRRAVAEWFREGFSRGYLPDPNYPNPARAPYNQNTPGNAN